MCGSSCVGLLIPIVNLKIFDNVIPQKNISLLIKLIILELIFYFIQSLTKYIANIIYVRLGNNINLELKEMLLNKISKLSGTFFSTKKTGDLITLILEDVNAFESLMVNSLATLLSDIIIYVPICCYVLYLQPILFICLLIIHPLLLENGRIVEWGTSGELLKQKGKYFQLYSGGKISSSDVV